MADVQIQAAASESLPWSYTIPPRQRIWPKSVCGTFNGANASGQFECVCEIVSDAGIVVASSPTSTVAAGASAVVSWFPGGDLDTGSTASTTTGGTISDILSPLATLQVTSPKGPTTLLDLTSQTLTPGTYGDGSHSAQVTVNQRGVVTAVSQTGITGGTTTTGFEIGYDQITTTVNVASTTEATGTSIIAGSSYTFDGAPVLATFFSPLVRAGSTSGSQLIVCLFEGATEITRLGLVNSTGGAVSGQGSAFVYRFTPSAGNHTYSVTAFATNVTGTPIIGAGSGGTAGNSPAFLRFTKV